MKRRSLIAAAAAAPLAWASSTRRVRAEERLKVGVGEGATFDTALPVLADKAGIFSNHGLGLDFIFTQGGGETIQTVVSRSVDIGIGVGTAGVMGAFAKGAPLRIISAQSTGAGDFYWFVPAASPIRSMKDISGKTVAYSTMGASVYAVATHFAEQFGVTPTLVATGAIPSTYTATMSGQVDVGWLAAPFGLDAIAEGKIRVLVVGNEVGDFKNQTVRVNICHAAILERRGDVIKRFLAAYEEGIDWMYSSPQAVEWFAERAKVPLEVAIEDRDRYMVKAGVQLRELHGMKDIMADAITAKLLSAPLTDAQMSTLVQIKQF